MISAYLRQPAGDDGARVVIGIGDLASGDERPVVVQLGFPAHAGRPVQTARARLVWRADGAERRTEWRAIDFTYASDAACDAEEPDPVALHWVGLHEADRAQLESIKLRREGDHLGANAVLHATAPFDDHFTPVDIDHFSDDDTVAGGAIGKMLALFFLYTIIGMSISAWWTYSSIGK